MDFRLLRRYVFGILISVSINSLAQAPPAVPFDAINWKATLKRNPSTNLQMGTLRVQFERTTLDDVRRAASAGAVAHRGDAGGSEYWLCYTDLNSAPVQRIWLVSDGEMGGPEHSITRISAQVLPHGRATAECPALPNNLGRLSLDNHLWLGVSKAEASKQVGAPSFQKEGWQSYDFQGKAAGSCGGAGFDLLASLWLHFEAERVNALRIGQVVSC